MSIKPVPAQPRPGPTLRLRLREALRAGMKSRDRIAVGAVRSALAAIDNAEAVQAAAPAGQSLAIEHSPVGVGAADVGRRALTEADVVEIVRAEVTDRETAASEYDTVGQRDRAELLRAEAQVLLAHLADNAGGAAQGGTAESAR
jgi:uncharacterized protein